jgi:hypothetical protein
MDAFLPYLLVFLPFVWKVEAFPLLASGGGGGVKPDGTTAKNIVSFLIFVLFILLLEHFLFEN